jgi:hypothetical protein
VSWQDDREAWMETEHRAWRRMVTVGIVLVQETWPGASNWAVLAVLVGFSLASYVVSCFALVRHDQRGWPS